RASRSPDPKPVGGEEVPPPEPEPISEGLAIAFRLPPTVLERHLGSAVHARKGHFDFRACRWIEGAAPPLEHETLARLPHEDRADLGALTIGKFLKHSPALGAGFESNRAWHRGRNAEPRIASPPHRGFPREDLERGGRIRRDDRRDSDARRDLIHGAACYVFGSRRGASVPHTA